MIHRLSRALGACAARLLAKAPPVMGLIAAASTALWGDEAAAEQARIAVAANFTVAARALEAAFERAGPHRIELSFGSTGQLYAQIRQGAPFDAFLAADQARPARLEAEGAAAPGSRVTYAVGRLALYSLDPDLVAGPDALIAGRYDRLAIANPRTAPYGAAAIEALAALDAIDRPERRASGINIAQTFQFVATGAADLGLVALAQAQAAQDGAHWLVPAELHAPIAQDAVLLTADNAAAGAFLAFLTSAEAQTLIASYGYEPAR